MDLGDRCLIKGGSIVRISRRLERGLKLVEQFIERQTLTKIKGEWGCYDCYHGGRHVRINGVVDYDDGG